MKCRAFLDSITKKAFSDRVELLFTAFIGKDCDMSFPSGQLSIAVSNPTLFDTFIPGNEYQIDISIVESKDA